MLSKYLALYRNEFLNVSNYQNFKDEEMKTQMGQVTYPRPHSCYRAGLGLEPGDLVHSPCSQPPLGGLPERQDSAQGRPGRKHTISIGQSL